MTDDDRSTQQQTGETGHSSLGSSSSDSLGNAGAGAGGTDVGSGLGGLDGLGSGAGSSLEGSQMDLAADGTTDRDMDSNQTVGLGGGTGDEAVRDSSGGRDLGGSSMGSNLSGDAALDRGMESSGSMARDSAMEDSDDDNAAAKG